MTQYLLGWLAVVGCHSDTPTPVQPMSAVELLSRTSLDVRGIRPTPEEIAKVESSPEALDEQIEAYLHTDRFGGRVAQMWSEIYLTETETWPIDLSLVDTNIEYPELVQSLGREPLQILAHMADNDLPYTTLVTADWTMANEVTAAIWPIDRPNGDGWLVSHYTDGRPAAGVLSTNSMWWRYSSTDSNANRKRANQTSRILLCNNYLVRPIDFDRNINLLDQQAIDSALRSNPSCVNCHASLDPLASYFFGFWTYSAAPAELSTYHPDRELRWMDYTGTPPAYYGERGNNLADLGRQIASDNRFAQCAVEQAWELLLRRKPSLEDHARLTEIRDRFIEHDLTIRSLLQAIIDTPEYRSGPTDAVGYVPKKLVTPELLASQIEDLTGFRWTLYGQDRLWSDMEGFRTLSGGSDGTYVTETARSTNATIVLVQKNFAEAAASYVVSQDFEHPDTAKLLTEIDFSETPTTNRDAMAAQIQLLHLRLFGHRIDSTGPEVTANLDLWTDLYAIEGDTQMAWTGLLSVLFRDPDFVTY